MPKPIVRESFSDARTALRDGCDYLLQCVKPFRSFTFGQVYPVMRFDDECALFLREDDSDEFRLTLSSKAVSCFQLVGSRDEAAQWFVDNLKSSGQDLLELASAYQEVNTFAVGDLITWKTGMDNRKYPVKGSPAVVLEVLDTPITNLQAEITSIERAAVFDIKVGARTEDGTFITFYVEGARFQHDPR